MRRIFHHRRVIVSHFATQLLVFLTTQALAGIDNQRMPTIHRGSHDRAVSQKVCGGRYPNPPLSASTRPATGKGDPLSGKTWHLFAVNAPQVWSSVTAGNPGVRIAIIDSGIDYNHPDINANLARNADGSLVGWDYIWSCGLPFDRDGHGTFVAAIAAAIGDNGIGTSGVCPHCSIMPLRFLNYDGLGDTEDAIESIYRAIKNHAAVINLSFAGEGYDEDLKKAIMAADAANIVVVVAAGNDHENVDNSSTYPAKFALPNMLTVSAIDQDGKVTSRSNWGKHSVNIAAPGEEIWSLWLNGEYDKGDGTSLAAPVVAGVAGLVRSANPSLNARVVVQIIEATVHPLATLKGKTKTEGMVDAMAAVKCAKDPALSCLKGQMPGSAVNPTPRGPVNSAGRRF